LPPLKLAVSGSASNSTGSSPSAAVPHSVTLGWTASAAAGYHVYRSEVAGGPFNRINSGQLQTTSYKDTGVVGGGQYFYVVTAVGDSGSESAYSNEVSVVIPTN
jgi:fibronectin type 3 domain-containing protein